MIHILHWLNTIKACPKETQPSVSQGLNLSQFFLKTEIRFCRSDFVFPFLSRPLCTLPCLFLVLSIASLAGQGQGSFCSLCSVYHFAKISLLISSKKQSSSFTGLKTVPRVRKMMAQKQDWADVTKWLDLQSFTKHIQDSMGS